MANVAVIEKVSMGYDYSRHFNFEFDTFALCSDRGKEKILTSDVDINIDTDAYEWVVLIGSEALKHFTKATKITEYSGTVLEDKFLPAISPAMAKFRPEAKAVWKKTEDNINAYVSGSKQIATVDESVAVGIQDTEEANNFIRAAIAHDCDYVALDSETTALYPRNGYMLGISICYDGKTAVYIDTDCFSEETEALLQRLFNVKRVIFHNAKFDIPFFEYHFNFEFPNFEDTMLMHYVMEERPGTHGLKQLAMQLTPYGDYEKPMYDWMDQYRKEHGVLKDDFKWEWIPFDIMKTYAAIDALVTFQVYEQLAAVLKKGNPCLSNLYQNILIPACRFLMNIQDNGVPFDMDRLVNGQGLMSEQISQAAAILAENEAIRAFEEDSGKTFNPNSVVQLRKVLFDYCELPPTGIKTAKGEFSTNAEVLEILSSLHEVPAHILNVRKKGKIKNTYLDKIIPQLDKDGRLRTNFNLHGTTSGRLSSSGKLNMQQIPRDDPIIKGCIKAAPGHKIVAMDLTTAEVYVAAVLSNDVELQEVFKSGGNFHSTIAHKVFNLPCGVSEVAEKFSEKRQAAKAVTFGIMYGAGPKKISEQVTKDGGTMSMKEAQIVIRDYFAAFPGLSDWIEDQKAHIARYGELYSLYGRKRRLRDGIETQQIRDIRKKKNWMISDDEKAMLGAQAGAVRSGLNFLVQSSASDINLLGAVDAEQHIRKRGMKSRIFALVHDSVLAEVPLDEIDDYCLLLKTCIQKDRGIMIEGCPVGCDFEIGDDYSMGKFDAKYANL